MSDAQLEILASRAGLAVDWIDANGRPQKVAPSVLRSVLTGLGHPAGSAQEIDASLQRIAAGSRNPATAATDYRRLRCRSRSGPSFRTARAVRDPPRGWFAAHPQAGRRGDSAGVRLPVGYQHVRIAGQTFTLAVAPERCFSVGDAVDSPIPRTWGLSVQLYALRRKGDGGFGDTQALEDLARVAGERGAEALAISPLHAMFASDTRALQSLLPSSRLFLNSLYCAPGTILGEHASARRHRRHPA